MVGKKREKKVLKKQKVEEINYEKINKKQNKQLITILVVIGVILILIITIYILIQKSKKFSYQGVDFERIMYGELPLYYTNLVIHKDGIDDIRYNLYLRKDPRSNNMPVNADIKFGLGLAYITVDEVIMNCPDTSLGLINIASFLKGLSVKAKGATSNYEVSISKNYPYINCETTGSTILSLEYGEKNEIIQDKANENCYRLKINNCNVINVTEKFIVETVSQKWVDN